MNDGMNDKYILDADGRTPILCDDVLTWAAWFEKPEHRRVARTELPWGTVISTVFLALNHNWSDYGTPILWETMIFGGACDEFQRRYSSYRQALIGHNVAVEMARSRDLAEWYIWPWLRLARWARRKHFWFVYGLKKWWKDISTDWCAEWSTQWKPMIERWWAKNRSR